MTTKLPQHLNDPPPNDPPPNDLPPNDPTTNH